MSPEIVPLLTPLPRSLDSGARPPPRDMTREILSLTPLTVIQPPPNVGVDLDNVPPTLSNTSHTVDISCCPPEISIT